MSDDPVGRGGAKTIHGFAMMALAPGVMVTPHVRLVRKLGEGGMGTVWAAAHLRLESEVAVKFVDPLLIRKDPSLRTRFRCEATAAAKINSPHVVRVFDHGEMNDGSPFIVMELLEGESLADRLARAGPLRPRDVEELVVQLCKVLRLAHQHGVVHRDIKPGNLFLLGAGPAANDEPFSDVRGDGEDLFVKILDFGIAKEVNREGAMTVAGSTLGTPEYMSPEQILSAKDVDFRADLWAVAVVAYECLAGSAPFSGETLGAVMQSVCSAEFTLPSRLPNGPPAELDAWFVRALAKDPAARFGSARELAHAFARAVAGLGQDAPVEDPLSPSLPGDLPPPSPPDEPIPAAPQTPPTTAASWSGATLSPDPAPAPARARRPWWLGVVAAALAVGVAGIALLRSGSGAAKAVAAPDRDRPAAAPASSSADVAPPTVASAPPPPSAAARAPSASASSRVPKAPPPAAQPGKGANCSPPYFIDAHGEKKWKTECL